MSRQQGFKSVRMRQVFWLLTVAMVPLIIVVVTLYHQRSAVIRGTEFEKLQTIRDLKVRQLNTWLDERTGDVIGATEDFEVRSLEKILATESAKRTPEDLKAIETARQLLRRYLDRYNAYSEIFIIGAASGKVEVSSLPAHEGQDKSKDPYFTEAMRTKETWIKDIYYSKSNGKLGMTFSLPIHGFSDPNNIIGVLVARIDLHKSLFPLLRENTGFGKTGETLIVNRDSIAVNELRWDKDAPLKL